MSDTVPPRRSARVRRLVLAAIGVSVAAAVVGNALLPVLLARSPTLLLAVQSSYAQMGLASPRLDPATFVAVAAVRRWLGELVAFLGGRVLGGEVLHWYQRRTQADVRLPGVLDGRSTVLRDVIVVALPHPLLSALFGMAGMSPRRFTLLKLLGSVLTVLLFRRVAGAVDAPLTAAGQFVDANVALLTAAGVLTAVVLMWQRRRSRDGDTGP